MATKVIMITGAEGYVGRNFINLYSDKYEFILNDKKSTIGAEDLNELHIKEIDGLIHLAAISGIDLCSKNISKTIVDNISSTINVIQLCSRFNIPLVLLSSQAAKNPESSFYAMTKKVMEVEALRYISNYNSQITVLRPANIYGGVHYLGLKNSVIAKFLKTYLKNEPLQVHGDGNQTRDFVHVSEVCKCIDKCLYVDHSSVNCFDVGTGIERTIRQVAQLITADFKIDPSSDPGSRGNVADRKSLDKLEKYIGYKPQDYLRNYIEKMVAL